MMKCFFKLVIIYGIQQEVLTHTINVERRVHALRHKLKKHIKEVHLKTQLDEPQEFMDNYDLIVGDPTEIRDKHPHLRTGHRHRKHRSSTSTNASSTTNFTLTTALISNSSPKSTTTTKTTAKNKSNDSSKKNEKVLKEKVKEATTSKTTAKNKSNDNSKTNKVTPATTTKTTAKNKSNDNSKTNKVTPATTTKTTAKNKSNDNSKTNKVTAATTTKTTAKNKSNDNSKTNKVTPATTTKTTAKNKSNDNSKKNLKDLKEKVTAATTIKTTVNNTIHDSFETNVKVLEDKVEAALTNLTIFLNQYDKGNIATTTHPPRRGNHKVSPRIPFYRRFNYLHDVERKKPQKWVHCLDLITPRLQGIKDDSRMNQMNSDSPDIRRLAQLLFTDVSQFNAQDMVSLLSQISKIRIRMYQWDQTAITIILNVIIKGTEHSFRTLKAGIKELVTKWHLDITNLQVFLDQMRIFRPPCIDISGQNGFTKKPGVVIPYTKPDKPTKKKHDPDVSCQSREKHEPYDNNNP